MNAKAKIFIIAGIIILLIVAVVVFIWKGTNLLSQSNPEPSPAPTVIETPTPTVEASQSAKMKKDILVDLKVQNNSSESGIAKLSEVNGKVIVTLSLTGGLNGVVQPAHIHAGKCPKVGDVEYPLTNVVDGKSETTLDTTLDILLSHLPLAINVHKSTKDTKTYVSCGDIVVP